MKTLFSLIAFYLLAAPGFSEDVFTKRIVVFELPSLMSTTDVYRYAVSCGACRMATYEEFHLRAETRRHNLDRDVICFGSEGCDKNGHPTVAYWKFDSHHEWLQNGIKKDCCAWAPLENMWPAGTYFAFIVDRFVF